MPINTRMERDSKNRTPTLDIEPIFKKIPHNTSKLRNSYWCCRGYIPYINVNATYARKNNTHRNPITTSIGLNMNFTADQYVFQISLGLEVVPVLENLKSPPMPCTPDKSAKDLPSSTYVIFSFFSFLFVFFIFRTSPFYHRHRAKACLDSYILYNSFRSI